MAKATKKQEKAVEAKKDVEMSFEEKKAQLEKIKHFIALQIKDIRIEDIIELGKAKEGGSWYKDKASGTAYRMQITKGKIEIIETRQSKIVRTKMGRPTRVDIKCEDCGATRNIATQDVFQVKRCVECQKKYKNRKRAELAKKKRAENRTEKVKPVKKTKK